MLIKNTRCKWFGDYYCTEQNTKYQNRIPNTGSLVTTTVSNTKISEVENKIPDNSKYITTQKVNDITFCSKIKTS